MTHLWSINLPFPKDKWGRGPEVFDVWHIDPEKGGSDDSCDWFGSRRKLNPEEDALAEAVWNSESIFGNPPFYASEGEYWDPEMKRAYDAYHAIDRACREWRGNKKRRIHPRWHVWHWRVRFMPVIQLRWALTRCGLCGKRMGWNAPAIGKWGDDSRAHMTHNPEDQPV